jgi:hypothetical protein
VPTKPFRGNSGVPRYRRLKIEAEAFFFPLAPADSGSDLFARFGE